MGLMSALGLKYPEWAKNKKNDQGRARLQENIFTGPKGHGRDHDFYAGVV